MPPPTPELTLLLTLLLLDPPEQTPFAQVSPGAQSATLQHWVAQTHVLPCFM